MFFQLDRVYQRTSLIMVRVTGFITVKKRTQKYRLTDNGRQVRERLSGVK